jgi:hypothetical protein
MSWKERDYLKRPAGKAKQKHLNFSVEPPCLLSRANGHGDPRAPLLRVSASTVQLGDGWYCNG